MQVVVCKIQNCGFRSANGFCLNRVVCITEQGVCKYLTKEGWDRQVEEFEKSTWRPHEFTPEEEIAIEQIEEMLKDDERTEESSGVSDQM